MSKAELGRLARFLLVGAINTALTGGLLLLLAGWLPIELAYTCVYLLGLAFTTFCAARFVFRLRLTARGAGRFAGWYVCVYVLGVSIIHIVTHQWHGSRALATATVLLITVPLNFFGGRRALGASALRPST